MGPTPHDRPTLYEFAGGDEAFGKLAAAHHARCLADPELNHPFSHPDQNPRHVERLAAYWAQVMGGPPAYTQEWGGDQAFLVDMHAGNGDMSDLARRFVECFVLAADDAGLPDDPGFRAALRAYMEWAVQDVALSHPHDRDIPADLKIPGWSWDGPQLSPQRHSHPPRASVRDDQAQSCLRQGEGVGRQAARAAQAVMIN